MISRYFIPFADVRLDLACKSHLDAVIAALAVARGSGGRGVDALAEDLIREHAVLLPELDVDAVIESHAHRRVPDRCFAGRSRLTPTAVFRIPFSGDPFSLRCYVERPNVSGIADFYEDDGALVFEFLREGMTSEEIAALRDRNLAHVRECLPAVRSRLEIHNASIGVRVRRALDQT